MKPEDIAGVIDPNEDLHLGDPTPVVTPPVPPVPEPTMAEIIAAEMGKVTAHIDERFTAYDAKLDSINKPAELVPTTTTWKPESWDDFPALVEQKGEEAARRILQERDDAAQAASDQAAATQAQIDTFIDGQITNLEKTGKLPAMVDANSDTDPGKLARQELFGFAAHLGTPNLEQAQATLDALHAAGQTFDHKTNTILKAAQPNPGKAAPVASSSAGGAVTASGPSYKDISTLSTDQLLEKYPNGF